MSREEYSDGLITAEGRGREGPSSRSADPPDRFTASSASRVSRTHADATLEASWPRRGGVSGLLVLARGGGGGGGVSWLSGWCEGLGVEEEAADSDAWCLLNGGKKEGDRG